MSSTQDVNLSWDGIFLILFTSLIWGVTNPFVKAGSKGVEQVEGSIRQWLYLLQRKEYVIPWLMNLSGSILFYVVLSRISISIAAPVTNTLTFLLTELTSRFITKEKKTDIMYTYTGIFLVLCGTFICMNAQR